MTDTSPQALRALVLNLNDWARNIHVDMLGRRYLLENVAAVLSTLADEKDEYAKGVLVLLHRPEGYEDVLPQLVAEDAINPNWPSWLLIAQE